MSKPYIDDDFPPYLELQILQPNRDLLLYTEAAASVLGPLDLTAEHLRIEPENAQHRLHIACSILSPSIKIPIYGLRKK